MLDKPALDDLFGFHDLKRSFLFDDAEVAERLNAPVLKTGNSVRNSGVRNPLSAYRLVVSLSYILGFLRSRMHERLFVW